MYPYFDAVVGLEWSNDPESYAGGSIATGRVSHARQVKVMTQTKRDTLIEPGQYNPNISNGGNANTFRNFPRQVRRLQLVSQHRTQAP